jgi:hypothetical protein
LFRHQRIQFGSFLSSDNCYITPVEVRRRTSFSDKNFTKIAASVSTIVQEVFCEEETLEAAKPNWWNGLTHIMDYYRAEAQRILPSRQADFR